MIELRYGENLDKAKAVGIFPKEKDCYEEIWCREDFDPPYFRTWGTEFVKTIDFGSHSKFYYMVKIND